MRIVRVLMVMSGWLILLVVVCVTINPILYWFVAPDGYIYTSVALYAVAAAMLIGFPIFYGASFAIAPLIYATMELFDDEH